jgi:ornithine cyclodeaminase/alanine dehydrogenase-like protein (mu-crystallin family)
VETLILSEREVEDLLDLDELLDGLADGFVQLSAGAVNAPDRNEIPMPGEAFLLSMPGHREGAPMTVKVVTVYEQNIARGLPSHLAVICLFDAETGACTAVMDGTYITAVRTAASAAVSCRALAREDASVLTIVGAGVQGYAHLRTVPLTREIAEIRVASLVYEDAERLASYDPRAVAVDDLEAAVRTSDVVALATHAGAPVIDAGWVRPGTHVSSVGYRPPSGELPVELLDRGLLCVEQREAAFAPTPVGCAELAGVAPSAAVELGEVLAGTRPGRVAADQITVYKAMGHVIEDMVAAELAARAALERGVGLSVELHAGRVTGVA